MGTVDAATHYPTDLSDAEWALLEPLIPVAPTGRPRTRSMRTLLNAIFYELRSGCAWRLLPADFGPWSTPYRYFRLWRDDGTWAEVNDILREQDRVRQGRDPEPSAGSVDSQSVTTTERGGRAATTPARR